MANPWFRMYCDFLDDPKIISLAFEDQRHFVGVLALKSAGIVDSDCDENVLDRIVAQRLWIDYAIIFDVKRRLVDAGLIDWNWQPRAWNKRQFVSDHDVSGAERQRRFREKERYALRNVTRNGPVTLPDTDTDTDTEIKTSSASPVGFAEFWAAYPKKKSKGAAEKAWKRIKPDLQTVLQAIERAKTSADWLKEQGQFIPHPATWLNAKGWEDELTAPNPITSNVKPWFLTSSGIESKALELGILKSDGEVFPLFRNRVYEAAKVTQEAVNRARIDWGMA